MIRHNRRRLVGLFFLPLFLVSSGCQMTEAMRAAEAARIAEEAAEDDKVCRLAGFSRETDPYRFCRKERMLTR